MPQPLTLNDQDESVLRKLIEAARTDRWAGTRLTLGQLPEVPNHDQLPTASAYMAFRLIAIRGLPDVVYCCLRDAAGDYDWRVVATG